MTGILQVNLNHSKAAQDLMIHNTTSGAFGLVAVSEPNGVPSTDPRWFSSTEEKPCAAVFWPGLRGGPPCVIFDRGPGFVAVTWGELTVMSCSYLS